MSDWPLDQFHVNGVAVIEDFFTEHEADELRKAGLELCENAPEEARTTFGNHMDDRYFFESSNKIHYFYEKSALDDSGKLLVNKQSSFNKVGHALHVLHPVFKKYTFDERVKNVAKTLGFKKPAIPQSMFIYKNKKIGAPVTPHQDATFLHTDPISITGFWIPTEDATLENGCLWFIKGSHKNGLDRRMLRVRNGDAGDHCIFDKPPPEYSDDQFTACPVKKGSLVLIHGLVLHRSGPNLSDKSRYAYTFHIMETENVKYSPENWLQLPSGEQFAELY